MKNYVVFDKRTELGLNQKQFGEPIGMDQARVSSIENGAPIGKRTALKLNRQYGIPLEDLLKEDA